MRLKSYELPRFINWNVVLCVWHNMASKNCQLVWRRNPYPHPAGRSSFICLLLGHPSGLTFPVWLHVCPGPILQVARDLCEDSGSVSLALQGHGQGLRDRNGQAGSWGQKLIPGHRGAWCPNHLHPNMQNLQEFTTLHSQEPWEVTLNSLHSSRKLRIPILVLVKRLLVTPGDIPPCLASVPPCYRPSPIGRPESLLHWAQLGCRHMVWPLWAGFPACKLGFSSLLVPWMGGGFKPRETVDS